MVPWHPQHCTGTGSDDSLVYVQHSLGAFEQDDEAGLWTMSYLQAEYRVMDELSLNVGIPWIRVSPYGDVSQTGLAICQSARVFKLLIAIPPGDYWSALTSSCPLGQTSKRLGMGTTSSPQ